MPRKTKSLTAVATLFPRLFSANCPPSVIPLPPPSSSTRDAVLNDWRREKGWLLDQITLIKMPRKTESLTVVATLFPWYFSVHYPPSVITLSPPSSSTCDAVLNDWRREKGWWLDRFTLMKRWHTKPNHLSWWWERWLRGRLAWDASLTEDDDKGDDKGDVEADGWGWRPQYCCPQWCGFFSCSKWSMVCVMRARSLWYLP